MCGDYDIVLSNLFTSHLYTYQYVCVLTNAVYACMGIYTYIYTCMYMYCVCICTYVYCEYEPTCAVCYCIHMYMYCVYTCTCTIYAYIRTINVVLMDIYTYVLAHKPMAVHLLSWHSFEAGIQTIYSNENRRQICPLNP